ncbi:hypothetical protein [Companilactobacillus kedongensis]|uniref:hypothetical protein n=1 Tax=Companilactobacillus kedongensis TaxID=2486004 RepID=UPI000F7AA7D0|nr:hypothetical protein [Companilactobacillus kedongensis]
MKDKKDLKGSSSSVHYLLLGAKVIAAITAVIFFVMLSRGVVNAAVTAKINGQYQDKTNKVLKTHVDSGSVSFVGKLIKVSGNNIITKDNVKRYHELEQYIDARSIRAEQVSALFDGKSNYKDGVSSGEIDELDKKLLKEKNQDVYQKQRNRLDMIQIWFEQTQDANGYISKTWDKFSSDNASLDIKKISMVNAYYKLIKNKTIKKQWTEAVSKMTDYYANHKGASARVTAAKEQLDALRNSPLTEKYKAANVDIIGTLDKSDNDSDTLNNAGLTGKTVLYYDSSSSKLALMTNVNGNYVAESGYISVSNSRVSSGKYSIKKVITSAGNNDAIITDSSNSSFGQYLTNATDSTLESNDITDADNTTSDFNSATPVFWMKNNSSLSKSIYFSNGSTIGFIYSGGSSYSNGLQISSSDLSSLQSKISSGTIFYAD